MNIGAVKLMIGVGLLSAASSAQRPGDRQFPTSMNPAYEIINLLPSGFKPQVTGMDSLSDGRLVLSTREDSPDIYAPKTSGKIILVSGIDSYSAAKITYKIIAEGLFEPMGVAVVNDTIYTVTRRELIEFSDPDGSGRYGSKRTVCTGWPYGGYNPVTKKFDNADADDIFEWSFGLVYKDGFFFANLSSHSTTDVYQSTDRGSVIRMGRDNTYEIMNGGIRRSNGIGLGPYDDLFVTDNQGEWVPTNRLIHARLGQWYGYHNGPDFNKPQGFAPGKTAVWMEWYKVSRSPSQPALLPRGPYRGQMITGDCTDPNLRRLFLEKVQGEYQGAVFHFAAMDKAPANRFLMRPNGDILVGGLGSFTQGHSDWNWAGGVLYGLQVLRPTGVVPFDLLAVRAVQGGFDLEFTQAIGSAAENPGNYEIRSWGYVSERRYDSPKQNEYGLSVNTVKLSNDRKRVHLAIGNLKEGNVVYIRLKEAIQSQTNASPWVTEAWYTLNSFGNAAPLQPVTEPWVPTALSRFPGSPSGIPAVQFHADSRRMVFNRQAAGEAWVSLSGVDGRELLSLKLEPGVTSYFLSPRLVPAGIYGFRLKERKSLRGGKLTVY